MLGTGCSVLSEGMRLLTVKGAKRDGNVGLDLQPVVKALLELFHC